MKFRSLLSLCLLFVAPFPSLAQDLSAEPWKPQAQIAKFRAYLASLHGGEGAAADDIAGIEIVLMHDVNADSHLDFVTLGRTSWFCGSGGCAMDLYLANGDGSYRSVLDLFAHAMPRVMSAQTQGLHDVWASRYAVERQPVWSVYRWNGSDYALSHYRYCEKSPLEHCSSADAEDAGEVEVVEPMAEDAAAKMRVRAGAPRFRAPDAKAARVVDRNPDNTVLGKVAGKNWYLVEIWKGDSAFVSGAHVSRAKR